MNRLEYEAQYFDRKRIATKVASALRIQVSDALTATHRRNTKNIAVFNHFGKQLPGFLSFHDADLLLQEEGKRLTDAELQDALWSEPGVELADGFTMRDAYYGIVGSVRTFYEPLDAVAPQPEPEPEAEPEPERARSA